MALVLLAEGHPLIIAIILFFLVLVIAGVVDNILYERRERQERIRRYGRPLY